MFNLTPELSSASQLKDVFYAAKAGNGLITLAGKHGAIDVPGEGVTLGSKFLVMKGGVLVHENDAAEYAARNPYAQLVTKRRNTSPIISYSDLKKRKRK